MKSDFMGSLRTAQQGAKSAAVSIAEMWNEDKGFPHDSLIEASVIFEDLKKQVGEIEVYVKKFLALREKRVELSKVEQ